MLLTGYTAAIPTHFHPPPLQEGHSLSQHPPHLGEPCDPVLWETPGKVFLSLIKGGRHKKGSFLRNWLMHCFQPLSAFENVKPGAVAAILRP